MHLIPIALIGAFVLSSSVAAPIPTEADQIIPGPSQEVGTATALSLPTAPSAKVAVRNPEPAKQTYTVKMTAYNAVPGQTDADPFTTASGAYSNPEVVAARSRDLAAKLPFGTVVAISRTAKDTPRCGYSKVEDLIGYRVIADTMNARIVNHVDVLMPAGKTVAVDGGRMVNPGIALGACDQVTVKVVGKVDIKNVPKTQAELVNLIEGNTELARI
ncbi:MAG TPA: hypothetical protein VEA92_01965 [Candidatus Paceibacterota bacterium]|nr:hypothetical protein [Candidatus Paceibacterota bacterium]